MSETSDPNYLKYPTFFSPQLLIETLIYSDIWSFLLAFFFLYTYLELLALTLQFSVSIFVQIGVLGSSGSYSQMGL